MGSKTYKVKSLVWDHSCYVEYGDDTGVMHCKTNGIFGFRAAIYENKDEGVYIVATYFQGISRVSHDKTVEGAKQLVQAYYDQKIEKELS